MTPSGHLLPDDVRLKLHFGPYVTPSVRRGDWIEDETRGLVRVGRYSDALIPWPQKWRSNSRILCGDGEAYAAAGAEAGYKSGASQAGRGQRVAPAASSSPSRIGYAIQMA